MVVDMAMQNNIGIRERQHQLQLCGRIIKPRDCQLEGFRMVHFIPFGRRSARHDREQTCALYCNMEHVGGDRLLGGNGLCTLYYTRRNILQLGVFFFCNTSRLRNNDCLIRAYSAEPKGDFGDVLAIEIPKLI